MEATTAPAVLVVARITCRPIASIRLTRIVSLGGLLLALVVTATAALAVVPVTGEIAVNTDTAGDQADAPVAMDADGDFVIAWQIPDAGGVDDVAMRRFAADGTPLTAELKVVAAAGDQDDPAIASDAVGNGVVVYESPDGSGTGIRARLFTATGPTGIEIDVNTVTAQTQRSPAVAMDADGDFVIAWEGPDADLGGIYARRFNAAGVAQGGEISVSFTTTESQQRPAIAMDADGDFVIAWDSWGQDGDIEGVYARRFNAAGVAQGDEIPVNPTTTGMQRRAAVAIDADGDFVVVWEGNGTGDAAGTFAARFTAVGVPVSGELALNTTAAGTQERPSVAMDGDGDFAAAWSGSGPGDADGVFTRAFTPAGVPIAGEARVNETTASVQERPSLASDADGDLVVAWEGAGSGGAPIDVFARRFARMTVPPQPPTPTPSPTTIPPSAAPPSPPAPQTGEPVVSASAVIRLPSARRCVSRRLFRIRLARPRGVELVSARVTIDGKRAKTVRDRGLRSTVDLRGLPKGRFTVRIEVTTKAGRKLATTRRYRTCTPKRKVTSRRTP